MTLVDDLGRLKLLRIDAEHADVERLAFLVAQIEDGAARKKAVEAGVRWTRQNEPVAAQFLAWLLVYQVVLPLQILQAIVYTKDAGMVEVCGTRHFESDSIRHLKLPQTDGAVPRFNIKKESDPILVDFLAVEANPDTREPRSSEVEPQNKRHEPDAAALARKAEEDQRVELQRTVHRIVMGSMSAEEIAHKILRVASKKSGPAIVETLVQTCIDEKAYNRLYGNVVYKLCQQGLHWADLLHTKFASMFSDTCEDLNTNQISISGSLFGHLLSLGAIDWARMFSATTLDPDESTASNRILLQALMSELRREMGAKAVAKKLASPELKVATTALFTGDFAAQFWEAVEWPELAAIVEIGDSDSS